MNIPSSFIPYHPLSNIEIRDFFKVNKFPNSGVYMRDEKNNIYNGKDNYIIFNLDDEQNQGTHWVALYISVSDKRLYYFDPYGIAPPDEIVKQSKKNKYRLFYTTNRIQPDKSILCGYYAVAFLYYMFKGNTVYNFLYGFKMDGETENDKLIKEIFEKSKKIDYEKTENEHNTTGKGRQTHLKTLRRKGFGFDLVEKINKAFPETEFHLFDVEFEDGKLHKNKHSFTGPNTKLDDRISNIDDLMKSESFKDINYSKIDYITNPIDDTIDRSASEHDLHYLWIEQHIDGKDEQLKAIHEADEILKEKSISTMKNSNKSIQKRVQGAFVALVMLGKIKLGLGMNGTSDKQKEVLKFIKKHNKVLSENQQDIIMSIMAETKDA